MIIKRFNNFLLESQLIYKGDFRKILTEIKDEYWNKEESSIANFLLYLSGVELDLVHNYIKDITKPGLVSFIPDDKIDFNSVSIRQERIITKTSLLNAYGIPTSGLILNEDIPLIGTDSFSNDFKLIKTIDTDYAPLTDTKVRLEGYYFYYLQSNIYPEKFVVVYRYMGDSNEEPSIYPYNIPENRRSDIKVGRFINKLIDIYKKSGLKEYDEVSFSAADIEKFVNLYTSKVLFNQDAINRFEVVEGEDIKKWYHESNYVNGTGQLGNSCMKKSSCQDFFKIYIDNPDVCKLLILKDDTGQKIMGRALLWTTVDGKKFMDRIYTSKDSYVNLFKKWAEQNRYTIRTEYSNGILIVQVKPKLYSKYPYMDSLFNYLPDKGILINDNINVNILEKYPDIRVKSGLETFKKIFTSKIDARYSINGKPVLIYRLTSTEGRCRPY